MANKILYFDVETTGRDPRRNDITQLSGIVEIDGKEVDSFNLRCQPFDFTTIEPEALEVTGVSLEQLKTFDTPQVMFKKLMAIFDRHIDKFNREDKFTPAGYNVRFDLDFLQQFFIKNGEKYGSGSYQNWRAVDGLPLVHFLCYAGLLKLEDYKLGTVCGYYGIPIEAHDAMSDIRATRNLLIAIRQMLIHGTNDLPNLSEVL